MPLLSLRLLLLHTQQALRVRHHNRLHAFSSSIVAFLATLTAIRPVFERRKMQKAIESKEAIASNKILRCNRVRQ